MKFKKITSIILAAILISFTLTEPMPAYASDSDFSIVDGVLTKYTGPGGDVIIPVGVTSIGNSAFEKNGSLTSVTIPVGVTSIGNNAFKSCYSLKSVNLPDGLLLIDNYAFTYCGSLISITIPGSCKIIGDYAFCMYEAECSLENLTIQDGVISIGYKAFYECYPITNVIIPNSVTNIGERAFSHCVYLKNIKISESITSICKSTFESCPNLTNITIPSSVKSIGESAFYNCLRLTEIIIPDSVESIDQDAFSLTAWYNNQADGLVYAGKVAYKYKGTMPVNTSISLKSDTIGIGNSAFTDYTNLTNVIIPNGVTNIGSQAFSDCKSLTSVTLPNSVTSIDESVFNNCTSLINIIIPNSITSIGDRAFCSCMSLADISIPSSVKTIGDSAFQDCYKLKTVNIPNNGDLTAVGALAFENCEVLNRIDFPVSVTDFGYGIFRNCGAVTIYCTDGSAAHTYALERNIKYYLTDIVHVTGVQLNDTSLNMLSGTTNSLVESVLPYNAQNNDVVWGTSDPDVAIVSNEGLVTAKSQGTAIITVTTLEGGYSKSCEVTVGDTLPAGIATVQGSSMVIDRENRYIYGFGTAPTSLTGLIKTTGGATMQVDKSGDELCGTGSIVNILLNGEVIKAYTVVIFGDVNGDGNIDAQDADKCVDVQNWKIHWNRDNQNYFYKAGDVNGDGNIDVIDADIIINVTNWKMHIDQTTGLAAEN